ncbi:MAG: GDP-mannose 4,6-dehydratase [Candidatus Eisenbacteria bacterium]|nr:GDP-mannose 4,6-dehydratase [Candidatus Eisenbacteria bacterium]
MRVLITGVTGFVGSHLVEYIARTQPKAEVHGIHRWRSRTENIDHITTGLTLHDCDIRDATSVHEIIAEVKPDQVYHLAAQSYVPASWHQPEETLSTNVIGQLHLFEAIRRLGLKTRVLVAGSSEEYGDVHADEVPIRETNPLRPLSPYAVSKVAQDMLGYQYFRSYGLDVVRTRAFNHEGPRRGSVFVTSNFCKQVAEIEKGRRPPVLHVGNLEAKRDFTDVRDVVRAYWLALEKGKPGEVYNIGSNRCWVIGDMLKMILSMTDKVIEVKPDPKRMRPSDVPILLCDYDKFKRETGWVPEIPFEQTLRDLLQYWRER